MKRRKVLLSLTVLVCFIFIGVIVFYALHHMGKKNLRENIVNELTDIVSGTDEFTYETVIYGDEEYHYRENMINILCLGIDKEEPMAVRNDADSSMGQADAVFVLSMDLEEKKIRIILVPRDTMVTLQMYRVDGEYMGEREGQITLQYAYGDGQSLSATQMAKQVSSVMGNLPIHAYLAVNVRSLWVLNDVIGGVDVVMDEDYTEFNPAFVKGETVHLSGNALDNFLRKRDKRDPNGAYTRMHRMKLYMRAFFEQAKDAVKEDMTLPVKMLSLLENDIATSVTVDEAVYLVTEAMKCSFRLEDMYTLPGDNQLINGYMEYHLDEAGVQELMIDLFYDSNNPLAFWK